MTDYAEEMAMRGEEYLERRALENEDWDALVKIDEVEAARYRILMACAFLCQDHGEAAHHLVQLAEQAFEDAIWVGSDDPRIEALADEERRRISVDPQSMTEVIGIILDAWPDAVAHVWDRRYWVEAPRSVIKERRQKEIEFRRYEAREVCLNIAIRED